MAWTPTRRNDILAELWEVLDTSGDYTGAWTETAGIYRIRVACSFNDGTPTVRIDEGQYDASASGAEPRLIRNQSVPVSSNRGFAELDLSTRYFRLVVLDGLEENPFAATIRKV